MENGLKNNIAASHAASNMGEYKNTKRQTYKIVIELKSSTLTPLQSDTLFGHLCWSLLCREGLEYLQLFLSDIKDGVEFLISSAIPLGFLPRPILAPSKKATNKDEDVAIQNQRYTKAKAMKKTVFIKEEFFKQNKNSVLTDEIVLDFYLDDNASVCDAHPVGVNDRTAQVSQVLIKNAINRNTFTTIEGRLFANREIFVNKMQIFVRTDPLLISIEEIINHLSDIGQTGFGKRASTGKGAFKVLECTEVDLPEASNPNAFMTLSNYVPFGGDPRDGWYSLFTKWGKLGGEFSINGKQFKNPLLMYAPGSVFKITEELKPKYGGLVPGISNAFPDAVQFAFAFPFGVMV